MDTDEDLAIKEYRISNEKDLKDCFIESNRAEFEGFKKDNFNVFLSDDEYINDFIDLHKKEFDEFVKEDYKTFIKTSED